MRTILTFVLSGLFMMNINAQTAAETPVTLESSKEKKDDTTFLSFGNIKVIIYEEKDAVEFSIDEKGDTMVNIGKNQKKKDHFELSWEGFSVGSNGVLTYDNKTTLPEEMSFIEIDYARSNSVALNFADLEISLGKYVGIGTGLGIQWNRYGIKNNYNIKFNEDSIYGVPTPDYQYNRNVLKATYITMPLLLEFHTNTTHSKSFNIAVGVIGGYILGSKLKQDYDYEGRNYEFKSKGHYHFNPFQAYATARIGYGDVSLFANYGLTRIFEEGRGPQLYPFQFGLHLNL